MGAGGEPMQTKCVEIVCLYSACLQSHFCCPDKSLYLLQGNVIAKFDWLMAVCVCACVFYTVCMSQFVFVACCI